MPPIISIENLGKQYTLRHQGGGVRYRRLSEELVNGIKRPFRSLFRSASPRPPAVPGRMGEGQGVRVGSPSREEFSALRDVSLDVQQGEVLGIIGRNGAGKSTLLKILSRITEPTVGRVRIRGRVASLLEVGTGFHPELTGRENIFLNGAILGMYRAEINSKFDEIVAFAEIEKFLDTPVKRYSSGMYVRLAFAVAAHLEPEILIVDEVLAVGDATFQKKCLGKMQAVSKGGRTVLFVSHQIAAVTRLCKNVLWLHRGHYRDYGHADLICSKYLANGSSASAQRAWRNNEGAPGNDWVRLEAVEATAGGKLADSVEIKQAVNIGVEYQVLKGGKVLIPNIHLFTDDGTLIFISHDWYSGWRSKPKPPGRYRTTFTVPGNLFNAGRITVKVAMGTYRPYEAHFEEADLIAFTVVETPDSEGSRGDYAGPLPGVVRPLICSTTEVLS